MRKPWSTWMPSKYSLVAASGMPTDDTTSPAGTSDITAAEIQWRFPRAHRKASTAPMPMSTKDAAVASDRVTIDVLNAGSAIRCSTNQAASASTPPASPAATVRAAVCPADSSSEW